MQAFTVGQALGLRYTMKKIKRKLICNRISCLIRNPGVNIFIFYGFFSNLMIKKNILAFLKSNLESIIIMIAIQGKTAIDKKMGGILKSHTIPVTFEKNLLQILLTLCSTNFSSFLFFFFLSLFRYLKRDGSTIGHLFSICSDQCTQSYFWPKARQPPWALYFHMYREQGQAFPIQFDVGVG